MKRLIIGLFSALLFTGFAQAREIAITINKVDSLNVGDSIGVIVAKQVHDGVMFTPYLRNLRPGALQFSINKNVGCQGKMSTYGVIPAKAAGTAIVQLPKIHVDNKGKATQAVIVRRLDLDDIVGRTLVLGYASTGNTASAWGQSRVACGSLETYIK